MRSITQSIVLDRLQQALATRGIDLKRQAILEVAAETFGFLDGNAFVAAMKEGRFDPPAAETLGVVWHEDHRLTVLRDPLSASVYAIDTCAVAPATRAVRLGISPYGGLLQMPSGETDAASTVSRPAGGARKPEIVHVVDNRGNSNDPDVADWSHLLTTTNDIDVGCGPVHRVEAWRMARVDGKLHFAITASEEYDDHEQAVPALRSFQAYTEDRRTAVERLGGIVRCHDDTFFGRIEFELLLPADLACDVDDVRDWHEVIAILLGADHNGVTATFGPQVWVKDNALDTNPEGPVDFDVTVEVLLMGSAAARETEDYKDSSDDLQMAVFAPDWVRDWKGPFHVRVKDEIVRYLHERDTDAGSIDEGILRTVMPGNADYLRQQPDIGDPV